MPKSALMIRNITGVVPDEVASIISLCKFTKPLVIDPSSPKNLKDFQTLVNQGGVVSPELLKDKDVRDYIFESAKKNTGNLLILHLDYTKEVGTEAYIMDKLNSVEDNQHFSMFYLGGGHGGGHDGRVDDETSGLQKRTVLAIAKKLEDQEVTIGAGVFGSCYSAAFSNDFRGRLIPEGVMYADAVECNTNGFTNAAAWLSSADNIPFFTADDIRANRITTANMRDKFNEIVGNDPEVAKRNLVRAYMAHTRQAGPFTYAQVNDLLTADAALSARVKSHMTDMYDAELTAYARDIRALGANPATARLKEAVDRYPMIKDQLENGAFVLQSDVPAFADKLQREVDAWIAANKPAPDEDITARLNTYLETKFTTPRERNLLKVLNYLNTAEMSSSPAEHSDMARNFAAKMAANYDPESQYGPQLKVYQNEAALYKAVPVALKQYQVTSKAISTPTETRLMALDASTGKPGHTCEDAYDRVNRVIDLVRAKATVVREPDIERFNQASVMTEFNERFAAAAVASDKLLTGITLDDIEVDVDDDTISLDDITVTIDDKPSAPPVNPLAMEHMRAAKGQLDKMKDAATTPAPKDDDASQHTTGLS